jgi:Abnormal spindle-like microcephaly-assoc'd, ASPM-SPD-2-Hydin
MLGNRGVRGALLAGAVAVFSAAAGGVAWATIPGSDGAINGCYEKRTGILRVIDVEAGKACTQFELPISWNSRGLQGERGIQGERGSAGPAGPQGPAGPGLDSLEDLSGLACMKAGSAGMTAITVSEDGAVALRCDSVGGGGGGDGGGEIAPGDLTFAPNILAFGLVKIGTWADASVTFTNSRSTSIAAIDAVAVGISASAFEVTNGCGSLAPSASCTVRVRFRPTFEGVHDATLVIGNHPYPVRGQGYS